MTNSSIDLQHTLKELVDSVGFDNVLECLALYAKECAFLPNQSKPCNIAFILAADAMYSCTNEVSEILSSEDTWWNYND